MFEIIPFLFSSTILFLFYSSHHPSVKNSRMIETNMTKNETGEIIIVPRSEWGARDPKEIQELVHPVPKVIIHHSLMGGNNASTVKEEAVLVKKIQDFHMNDEARKWSDIGYSFLIGQSGTVFEGRGWNRIGAHSYGNNAVSIGICLLGDFTERLPTPQQIQATQDLIALGVRNKIISTEYSLFGHRDVRKGTECPGTKFYSEMLSTWPHKGVAKQDEIF